MNVPNDNEKYIVVRSLYFLYAMLVYPYSMVCWYTCLGLEVTKA